MEAKQEPTKTLLFSVLVLCVLSGQVQSVFNIPQCANRRAFSIGSNNQFSMTCTGLGITSNIYWSISSPITNFTEIRLGECDRCYPNCATTNCTVVNSRDYAITRHQSDVTTLTFVDNFKQNQGALIKCSQRYNTSQAFCATYFINAPRRPQFQLFECTNGFLEILPTQTVSLTCTGLWPLSNIYWSLSGPSTNHTEVRLGQCPSCFPNCSSTPCVVFNDRYTISRPRYDVTVVENAHLNDSDTFKCSQWNNATTAQSSCTIHIRKAYQLPQCEDGQLDVSAEEPWTAIRCEGLRSYHNITWTLTDSANQTIEIASCTVYSDRNNACSARAASAEILVSRTRDVSELRIVGHVKEKDNNTVTCVRQDGATGDSCRLRVISTEQDSPLPDTFQAAAVGGGVAAAVVVVVIVVVVVVFVKWKRRSHSSESGPQSTGLEPVIYENPVVSSEYAAAAGEPYDSLRMSDVGLSSEYSAIGNNNTGSQPQAGQPTHYESLQVSDIGQVSTYSVIGDNKNTSHCAGGDYEIP